MKKLLIPALAALMVGLSAVPAQAAPNPRGVCKITVPVPAGFPNCSNTGVPKWANLNTGVVTGDIVISPGENTTITNKVINGSVTADGTNVTIKKSVIRSHPDRGNLKLTTKNGGSIVIEDSEVDGNGSPASVTVGYSNITLRRVWVHNVVDGVRPSWNTKVIDSLVTDNVDNSKRDHNDSVQTNGGKGGLIQHSTLIAMRTYKNTQANAAVMIGAENSKLENFTVRDSFLDGGNDTVSIRTDPGMVNVRVINNTFGRNARYESIRATQRNGVTITGNKYANGTPVKVKSW